MANKIFNLENKSEGIPSRSRCIYQISFESNLFYVLPFHPCCIGLPKIARCSGPLHDPILVLGCTGFCCEFVVLGLNTFLLFDLRVMTAVVMVILKSI